VLSDVVPGGYAAIVAMPLAAQFAAHAYLDVEERRRKQEG